MAPLHARRRGFTALGFAVMVTLPQTALAVPAAGIDPAAEELQDIGNVAGIFSWHGSGEPLRTALIRLLGGRSCCVRPTSATSGFRNPIAENAVFLMCCVVDTNAVTPKIFLLSTEYKFRSGNMMLSWG